MKSYDIIIVGGGPAGIITAGTAKMNYPDKSILVIRKEKNVLVPCGIPYTMSTIEIDKNYIPDGAVTGNGSELLLADVTGIDPEKKTVKTSQGDFAYDKLVIATGSRPTEPGWLKGRDKKHVYYIHKSDEYLDALKKSMKNCQKVKK